MYYFYIINTFSNLLKVINIIKILIKIIYETLFINKLL